MKLSIFLADELIPDFKAHRDGHTHSQSTSKMARTDLARSLASAARAAVTVGPTLPSRARSALVDNVLLSLR